MKGKLEANIGLKYSCVQPENSWRKPDHGAGVTNGHAASAGPARSARSHSTGDANGSMTTHGWNTTSTPQYFVLDQNTIAVTSEKNANA